VEAPEMQPARCVPVWGTHGAVEQQVGLGLEEAGTRSAASVAGKPKAQQSQSWCEL